MRWGFVHDWIIHRGGAERLFFRLIKQTLNNHHNKTNKSISWYRSGDQEKIPYMIFTLISRYETITIKDVTIPIRSALPQRLSRCFTYYQENWTYKQRERRLAKLIDYRNLIVLYPVLVRRLSRYIRMYDPQNIRISSANISKNIKTGPNTKKRLYLHSPLMYIQPFFRTSMKALTLPAQRILNIRKPWLSRWDTRPRTYTKVRVNSAHTQKQAYKQYNIQSTIAYPYIDYQSAKYLSDSKQKEYFIYVGRLVKNLRHVDILIQFANRKQIPLIIVGDGPDAKTLREISENNIHYTGYIQDRKKIHTLISQATWYINLAYESAGMGTMEALLCGKPVFGYGQGGTAELINTINGITSPDLSCKTLDLYWDMFHHNIQNDIYQSQPIQHDIQQRLARHNRDQTLYPNM